MRIDKSTAKYEAWLGERIPLIAGDLNRKHALMKEAPFPFLRATFYRWAQTLPEVCPDLMSGSVVLGVGDLHVENFGTWRDVEGRLIWGINDFDEVAWIPYTNDLVRLAVSAHLAIAADHLVISPAQATKEILTGYRNGLRAGGKAFVLAEHHVALRQMAVERLKEPERYWDKLHALPAIHQDPPSSATKALLSLSPGYDFKYRIVHRVAGLGSLGRRRYVALGQWRGGSAAREAKELTESAWMFAHPKRGKPVVLYQEAIDRSIRCPDPFVKLRGRWIVRRLAPDCSRVELSSLPARHDAARLLNSMGFETANAHLGSREAAVLLKDLNARKANWLQAAALAMVASVRRDWEDWRRTS
jgi:Uncharacterized protein conserved in bacteria (DUF2252)